MVIYADVLFLVNFIFNYPALLILGKAMKLRVRQWRICLGGAVGALGSTLIFCAEIQSMLLKIPLAFLMIFCAYGWQGKQTFSVFAAFLLITAAVSGLASALVSAVSIGSDSAIRNGIVYFDISGKLLFMILLVVYPTICLLSKGLRARKNRKVYPTVIERAGKSVSVEALFDSGNKLKEPMTGRPVVVAEWEAVKDLFETPAEFSQLPEKIEEYRLWLIPYSALGKTDGRIFAFLADRISIEKQVTERVFIGVTNQTFAREYHALLNADLI